MTGGGYLVEKDAEGRTRKDYYLARRSTISREFKEREPEFYWKRS